MRRVGFDLAVFSRLFVSEAVAYAILTVNDFFLPVVQGADHETCGPDRFPKVVQHSVATAAQDTAMIEGMPCSSLAGGVPRRQEWLRRACESLPGYLTALFTNPSLGAQYHRKIMFDGIIGEVKPRFLSLP